MILRLFLGRKSWSYALGVNIASGERLEAAHLAIFTWVRHTFYAFSDICD